MTLKRRRSASFWVWRWPNSQTGSTPGAGEVEKLLLAGAVARAVRTEGKRYLSSARTRRSLISA